MISVLSWVAEVVCCGFSVVELLASLFGCGCVGAWSKVRVVDGRTGFEVAVPRV